MAAARYRPGQRSCTSLKGTNPPRAYHQHAAEIPHPHRQSEHADPLNWINDGKGMPDVLLFGGVYDDGCQSQEMWHWHAHRREWGWYDDKGDWQDGALPDPLC